MGIIGRDGGIINEEDLLLKRSIFSKRDVMVEWLIT
jgi:hypothetical protein